MFMTVALHHIQASFYDFVSFIHCSALLIYLCARIKRICFCQHFVD